MSKDSNEIEVLRRKLTWGEKDIIALEGYGLLFCAAEPYIYEKKLKLKTQNKDDYDITARAIDAALGLLHMCLKAVTCDRSHTVQELIDEYYDFLKVNGERNPFIDKYTTDKKEDKE